MGVMGAALAVGGDRMGGQEIALQSIHHFYIISEMIPVGGGSFGANLGGTFWSQDLMAEGAAGDEEGLRSMRKTANRMMKALGVVRGAGSAMRYVLLSGMGQDFRGVVMDPGPVYDLMMRFRLGWLIFDY